MNKDLTVKLYQSINDHDQQREVEFWHASSLAKCPRAIYLERTGVKGLPENEAGGGKKLRWRAGHAIEGTIRPELEKIYPNLITNVRFTNEELDLTGEFDAYDPDSKTLISVKSVHDFAMKTIDGEIGLKENTGESNARGNVIWGLKKSPYISHEWQEHAYVLLLENEDTSYAWNAKTEWKNPESPRPPLGIEQITYVYITLGGLIACYTTPVKPEILERVAKKVDYLNECWKNEELPVCLCQDGQEMYQVQDQYCPYRTATGCCDESLIKIEETVNVSVQE